jgi:hypothetical protein
MTYWNKPLPRFNNYGASWFQKRLLTLVVKGPLLGTVMSSAQGIVSDVKALVTFVISIIIHSVALWARGG